MHNVGKNCLLIYFSHNQPRIKSDSTELALMQSIVFTVRALETFTRDSFITCLVNIDGFEEEILKRTHEKYTEYIEELRSEPYILHEYLASIQNFQNLDGVKKAFYPLYKKNFLTVIDEYNTHAFIFENETKLAQLSMITYFKSWRTSLKKLYDKRHEITHNANHKISLDYDDFIKLFKTALMFGQITGIIIGALASTDDTPSSGQVLIEAPLYKIMCWRHFLMHGEPSLSGLFEKVKHYKDEKKLASIGPFVFQGMEILQCDFGNDALFDKKNVSHIIEISENGDFRIKNIASI
ncbi:HEPN domain-containing protein [Halomonas sp. GD1P12]|uniref:HEPN domain-containing protein n=1 Tax=Halomonas sp. GD1P12 TaxID=2982691 RepID=UPI0021E392B3|nr:HEPN domain-containing protein [Halomonas sp. GD1P12]UYG00174.1 HEPN domain-containing protein [Halomonas sp. GD1P12]